MSRARKPYPSDVSDDECSLVAPYLALVREDALQRHHPLRELFNGLRYVIRYGIAWRTMPNDLPPWSAVYQQAQRWMAAGCFEALVDDLRAVLRLAAGRAPEPSAAIFDSRRVILRGLQSALVFLGKLLDHNDLAIQLLIERGCLQVASGHKVGCALDSPSPDDRNTV